MQEVCRRIGEEKIELKNACVRVAETPAAPHAVGGSNGRKGRAWKVTDSRGVDRVFDHVS